MDSDHIQIERALLGAVLLNPRDSWPVVMGALEGIAEAFAEDQHRRIFTAIRDTIEELGAVDVTLLAPRLSLGDQAYLGELTSAVPTSANVAHYAQEVRGAYDRRRISDGLDVALKQLGRGEALADVRDHLDRLLKVDRPCAFEPHSIKSWLETPAPETQFLFDSMFPRGIVGVLYARSATGKTFFVLGLGLSLATGQAVFSSFKPTAPCRVTMVVGEDPPEEVWRRVRAIVQRFELDRTLIGENVRVLAGVASPLMALADGNPTRTRTYADLARHVERWKPDLVIIDPKAMYFGLDENSNDHAVQFMGALKDLASASGGSVLVSHHVSKLQADSADQHASRGASSFVDSSRWAAFMKPMDAQTGDRFDVSPARFIELTVTKSSYAPTLPHPVFFERGPGGVLGEVNLGQNRLERIVEAVGGFLAKQNIGLTRRELRRGNGPARASRGT